MADQSSQESPLALLRRLPFPSIFLAFLAFGSASRFPAEISSLTGDKPDVFDLLIDLAFFAYAANKLAFQFGFRKYFSSQATLAGLNCSVVLNLGREPGTAMPADWGASGARLSLPLKVNFSDEVVDLGFPGEEALKGRYAKRVYCDGGTFVGPQGEVSVMALGGAWKVFPSQTPGANVVRFFIDFPEEASRNDVKLPAGRVSFSSGCIDSEDILEEMDGMSSVDVVEGPEGIQLMKEGRLTIKSNSMSNAYGLFGDFNFILGKFSIST